MLALLASTLTQKQQEREQRIKSLKIDFDLDCLALMLLYLCLLLPAGVRVVRLANVPNHYSSSCPRKARQHTLFV